MSKHKLEDGFSLGIKWTKSRTKDILKEITLEQLDQVNLLVDKPSIMKLLSKTHNLLIEVTLNRW